MNSRTLAMMQPWAAQKNEHNQMTKFTFNSLYPITSYSMTHAGSFKCHIEQIIMGPCLFYCIATQTLTPRLCIENKVSNNKLVILGLIINCPEYTTRLLRQGGTTLLKPLNSCIDKFCLYILASVHLGTTLCDLSFQDP